MKMRLVVALAGLAMSFALPAFAQQKNTVDPKIAQQIRALVWKYDAAFNNHDAATVAALYTEDGVDVFHGATHGRQAIEKSYARDFQRLQPNSHATRVDRVIAIGNDVRVLGKWSDTFQETSGAPTYHEGYYSCLVVREGDTWKIRRDTFTENYFTPGGAN
jgi:uncharacterized protein (TIGR02246 family)